jgi:hypothetical protein
MTHADSDTSLFTFVVVSRNVIGDNLVFFIFLFLLHWRTIGYNQEQITELLCLVTFIIKGMCTII